MGGKGSAPPPPDYTPIATASKEAAEISAQISREQLAWARQQYAEDKELTSKVVDRFLRTQDVNESAAARDRARYEKIYQPLEDKLASEAESYASEGRKDLEMGRAQAAVGQQFNAARDAAAQRLESFGVDPTSTRFAALDIGLRAQEAAAKAAAGNQAGQMVDATGRALRSEAINVGRGYPGQVAQTYNTALAAGTGAVNSTLAQTASGANTMGTGAQWQGAQMNALGTWGNALNMGYQNAIAGYNAEAEANDWSGYLKGAGSLMGGAAGLMALAEGGSVNPDDVTPGGAIPTDASPTGGQAVDDVPAKLTVGEFVVPKDVTSWKGEEYFQKLIDQSRKAKSEATAKPKMTMAPEQDPTFVSRPSGALPLR
jgi:hypothetical protein